MGMPTQFKPRKSRPRTADRNLCPNCGRASPLSSSHCGKCGTTLVQPTLGTVAFWLLGEVDLQVVHALAERVNAIATDVLRGQKDVITHRSTAKTRKRSEPEPDALDELLDVGPQDLHCDALAVQCRTVHLPE